MLDALRFAQGAVARKDFVPALTHFLISDRRILGFNGTIALCSPIDLDLTCSPKAAAFVKAIETCRDTIQLNLTEKGNLAVRSGAFTTHVECCPPEQFPDVAAQGDTVELPPGILAALDTLAPFIAEDASRPWARGILFRGPSAFATNNIVLLEKWLGQPFPVDLNLPKEAVTELLRIGEEPKRMQVGPQAVTFHFADGRWLRTQLASTDWPDLAPLFDTPAQPYPFPKGFFEALADVAPFTDAMQRVYLLGDRVATSTEEGVGASVRLPGLPEKGSFNVGQLAKLEAVAQSIDFSAFPAPCPFFGDKLRGVIVGMH